jgi:hypothetical protein
VEILPNFRREVPRRTSDNSQTAGNPLHVNRVILLYCLRNKVILKEKIARISAKANGYILLCLTKDHDMRVYALYLYLMHVHEARLN